MSSCGGSKSGHENRTGHMILLTAALNIMSKAFLARDIPQFTAKGCLISWTLKLNLRNEMKVSRLESGLISICLKVFEAFFINTVH